MMEILKQRAMKVGSKKIINIVLTLLRKVWRWKQEEKEERKKLSYHVHNLFGFLS